ncbi:hypothetical protein EDB19DRAFT_1670776 [Suillus lakei]|nr:hypothetical protein EDB19DRAFT_1670776 [Suillus lakei]
MDSELYGRRTARITLKTSGMDPHSKTASIHSRKQTDAIPEHRVLECVMQSSFLSSRIRYAADQAQKLAEDFYTSTKGKWGTHRTSIFGGNWFGDRGHEGRAVLWCQLHFLVIVMDLLTRYHDINTRQNFISVQDELHHLVAEK